MNELDPTGLPHEIERKFKIDPSGVIPENVHTTDTHHAILSHPDAPYSVRVTDYGDLQTATVKSGSGIRRAELQVEITDEAFAFHAANTDAHITKTRYTTPEGYMLDVFHGHLEGLRIAEVEFESEEQAVSFQPPNWFGLEVTGDSAFYNSQLAHQLEPEALPGNAETGLKLIRARMRHLGRLSLNSGEPIVVGVAGPTASGKSSLTQRMQNMYRASVASTDDWHRGRRSLERNNNGGSWTNWDLPIVYDTAEMAKAIHRFKETGWYEKRSFDYTTEEPVFHGLQQGSNVLIVEGLYALDDNMRRILDLGIYVDANPAERIIRRINRDRTRTQWTAQEILRYCVEVAEPTANQYVRPQLQHADIVIESN